MVSKTKAIDVDCPACPARKGIRCGESFCVERVAEAMRVTREANRAARLKGNT